MPKLLFFEWPVHKGGYELLHARSEEVEPVGLLGADNDPVKISGDAKEVLLDWAAEHFSPAVLYGPKRGASYGTKRLLELLPDWFPPPGGEELFLAPKTKAGDERRPLDHNAAIFLEFAALESPVEMVAFANRYGLLWGTTPETVKEWQKSIRHFKRSIEQWRLAQKNGQYADLVSAMQLPNLQAVLSPRRSLAPELRISPPTFFEAMKMQFAQAICESSQLRKCAECPAWFIVGLGSGRRRSAHYCSDRCRKSAFLKRKREQS